MDKNLRLECLMEFPKDIAPTVKTVIESYPHRAQDYALSLRQLILKTATNDARIGNLTETLKWREPSYLTDTTKSGTTLRFDWKTQKPDAIGVFVNCKTTLIQSFKDLFPEALNFEGTRAIWLDLNKPLPRDILSICIGKTLTYHLDKG